MTTHVVAQPDKCYWLSDVATGYNEVNCEVPDANRDRLLRQEDDVTYRRHRNADYGEGVTMTEAICQQCRGETDNSCNDVDWYRHDLSVQCSPAKLIEDGRYEEGRAVARGNNPEIHQHAGELHRSATVN